MANNIGWGGNAQQGMGNQNMQQNFQGQGNMPAPRQNSWARNQPSFIPGRIVNSFDEILPIDVPMDGNPAVFLKNDGSAICVKIWSSNGQLVPYEYVLKPTAAEQEIQNGSNSAFQNEVFSRLDKIEAAIKKNNRPYNKPYTPGNKNKEVKNRDESRK